VTNSEYKLPRIFSFKQGFLSGLGWSFGVTLGFAIISTIVVYILNRAGGLPFIGSFIATIVEETQKQILKKGIVIPNY